MNKNKYLLFGYNLYYPDGGCNDFVCYVDSIEDAVVVRDKNDANVDVYQLADAGTFQVVVEWRSGLLDDQWEIKTDEINYLRCTCGNSKEESILVNVEIQDPEYHYRAICKNCCGLFAN